MNFLVSICFRNMFKCICCAALITAICYCHLTVVKHACLCGRCMHIDSILSQKYSHSDGMLQYSNQLSVFVSKLLILIFIVFFTTDFSTVKNYYDIHINSQYLVLLYDKLWWATVMNEMLSCDVYCTSPIHLANVNIACVHFCWLFSRKWFSVSKVTQFEGLITNKSLNLFD